MTINLIKAYFSRAKGEALIGKIDWYFRKSSRRGTEFGLDSDFDESDYDETGPNISEQDSDSFVIDESEDRDWDSSDDESACEKTEKDEEDWELDGSGRYEPILLHERDKMDNGKYD